MGCFPDKTLPQYKPLNSESERVIRRTANPNQNIDTLYVPIDVTETHTASKPFNKAHRTSPKKAKAHPVSNQHPQNTKFSRRQASVMKIDSPDKQRRINRKRATHHRVPIDRKRGALIRSPHRQHIITLIETPSESARTSILANFENNPSVFFVKMNEKDIDSIFTKPVGEGEENYRRMSYRSMSPRIHKQTSA